MNRLFTVENYWKAPTVFWNFPPSETEGVYGDKELNLRATIHGTNKNNYKVEVTLYYDEYGEPQDIDYYCPCEDFLTSDGICKHCVATILYYMHTDGQSKTVTSPIFHAAALCIRIR